MQCDKCQRHNSLRRDDACVIAPDVKKIYYVCSECGHTQVNIVDYSIRKNYNEEYKPDLWWEELPRSIENQHEPKESLEELFKPCWFDRVKLIDGDSEEE